MTQMDRFPVSRYRKTFWDLNPKRYPHTSNIFRDKELKRDSAVKDYLTTAADSNLYFCQIIG